MAKADVSCTSWSSTSMLSSTMHEMSKAFMPMTCRPALGMAKAPGSKIAARETHTRAVMGLTNAAISILETCATLEPRLDLTRLCSCGSSSGALPKRPGDAFSSDSGSAATFCTRPFSGYITEKRLRSVLAFFPATASRVTRALDGAREGSVGESPPSGTLPGSLHEGWRWRWSFTTGPTLPANGYMAANKGAPNESCSSLSSVALSISGMSAISCGAKTRPDFSNV
mmetsp:Transcript_49174/g.106960  ORF Transcript_49174/g.106960 Transcript_49174/m.106960 type:complete len:227 (-) Transcript_49174:683-1363(-)